MVVECFSAELVALAACETARLAGNASADMRRHLLAGELVSSAGIAKAVKLIRERLRITSAELSKISGVGVRSITQIEAGKGNPTLATIEALIRPLGLKVSVMTNLAFTVPPPSR